MKKRLLPILLLGGVLLVEKASAQFTLSGEVTPRTELRNGFKKPIAEGQDVALFTEQRSRINFGYASPNYELKISLQDVRIWGAVAQIYKADPSLSNVFEAYGKYKFGSSSISVGRMALDYDRARFLGNLGWAMQARSHDLALYQYKSDSSGVTLDVGVAFNQDAKTPEYGKLVSNYYSGVANYKSMQYVWFNKKIKSGNFSLLAHNNTTQIIVPADSSNLDTTSVTNMQTLGGFISTKASESVSIIGEAYYQTNFMTGGDVSAFFISAEAAFKVGKATLTVGGEYMSGEDGTGTSFSAFNPLYGTNHKFNGYMDYFYVGNGHGNVGLINPYLKVKLKTGEKSTLMADVHGFMSAVELASGSYLGTELDLVFVSKLADGVTFKIGQSVLGATESMMGLKAVPVASGKSLNTWSWAQIIFTPKFL